MRRVLDWAAYHLVLWYPFWLTETRLGERVYFRLLPRAGSHAYSHMPDYDPTQPGGAP
jgi:hypothetical protein